MPKIKLRLRRPHAAQQKVIDEAKRFSVLSCGRRWGKTALGIHQLIRAALDGEPVGWFAPSYKMLAEAWREVNKALDPVTIRKSVQEYRLELVTGGSIDFWSLDSPDVARGRKYKLVVIDEAAYVKNLEDVWQHVMRPTLTDLKGGAWFLSTPKGMNYFKTLFDSGQDPERADWASWQMPTSENPYIEATEIEALRSELSEAAFNQEHLALFVNWEGAVFRRILEAATAEPQDGPVAGHSYAISVDWGKKLDYTVFIVIDITTRTMVAMDRSNQVDYVVQRGRLKALFERWKPHVIIAEANSIGGPVIELLQREGLPVQAFTTTRASKATVIEALALAFERDDIRILPDPNLLRELQAYQSETSSGLPRYGAPPGQHDDCVMALALCWAAVSRQGRLVYSMPDADIVVPDFKISDHWRRAYAIDVRWDRVAVIWGALDPQSDVLYICGEYSGEADVPVHAAAIRSKGDWFPGLMDPAANGREQIDGEYLMQAFRKHGLVLQAIDNPFESGTLAVLERMRSGRLKVFSSCVQYLQERRLYRRDEDGQIVKENDSLQDALRCLVNGISRMCTKPVKTPYYPPKQNDGGPRSWMF